MLTSNINWNDKQSPYGVKAKVELFEGSTLVDTCYCEDILQSFTLERSCDMSKFFGYGICQKMNIKLLNSIKDITLSTNNSIKVAIGDGEVFDYPFPTLHITEVHKDEIDDISSITCYDALNRLKDKSFADLGISPPYTIIRITEAISTFLGLPLVIINADDDSFYGFYDYDVFDGTEPLREVLNAIAEATQTIYYINNADELVFKRLDLTGNAVLTITKEDYYELTTKTNRRLTGICRVTQLGNNIEAKLEQSGTTQYIRDNPLWDLSLDTDTAVLVENALKVVGGLTINQFSCDWDGNYLLEIGDKINIVSHDNTIVTSYYLDDALTYDGAIGAKTEWEYIESDSETPSNPTSIGDKLNQTYAKVDKIDKKITLYVSDTEASVAELQLTTDGISATVSSMQNTTQSSIDSLQDTVKTLANEVNASVTEEEVSIAISKTLANGVDKVVTSTKKYKFDDTGLHIGSSDSAISTAISEDGMRIHRAGTEVLRADNEGVKAEDLHATTYLIIGDNSRLQDWSGNYTACFWLGE